MKGKINSIKIVVVALSAAALFFGCSKNGSSSGGSSTKANSDEVRVGVAYEAAHGTQCFTVAAVAVKGNVIIDSYIDEFQFIERTYPVVGVPNSDERFGEGFAEGMVLFSKRQNRDFYSAYMAEHGNATVTIDANYDAIQAAANGKTIKEVEKLVAQKNVVDAVSTATLVDTANYLNSLASAAKAAASSAGTVYSGDIAAVKLNVAYGAPHGALAYAIAAVATDGKTILSSYLDEFQFLSAAGGYVGVPNSENRFGRNYAEGMVLASKRVNNEGYTAMMQNAAEATNEIAANYDAIQAAINGRSIDDVLNISVMENVFDAVSGATLVDTRNYISLLLETARM